MPAIAKKGDRVKVHYWGTLDDGTQFDSSEGKEPLEFTVGAGEMIEGFDKAVVGMAVGETKKIHIVAEQAYGARDESLVEEMPITGFVAKGIAPRKGMALNIGGETAMIREIRKDKVIIDFNPLLAGKALNFKIKLMAVK